MPAVAPAAVRLSARILAVALLFCLCGDRVPAQGSACAGTQARKLVAELLFGRNIGDRPGVSESAFAAFVAREIDPRFPGATIIDASGRYFDTTRQRRVRERIKLVIIVLPDGAQEHAKLEAVAAAYKTRFRQQSVGLIVREACVSFQ
jgi:hypothetical protein